MLGDNEWLIAYPWSSLGWYLAAPKHRPDRIRVDRLLGEHGIQQDSAEGREQFAKRMEVLRMEDIDEESLMALERGWCLGGDEFRQKVLRLSEDNLKQNHTGELHRETAEHKADRTISEAMARLAWKEADLACTLKNDRRKVAIALRVREETTVPLKWIAQRLQMGSPKSVNSMRHRALKAAEKAPARTLTLQGLQAEPMV